MMQPRVVGGIPVPFLRVVLAITILSISSAVIAGNDVTIVSGDIKTNISLPDYPNRYTTTDDDAELGVNYLLQSVSDNGNWLTTGSAGTNSQLGNITLDTDITFNRSNFTGIDTLTLQALNDIILNGRIYDDLGSNDRLSLTLNPNSDSVGGGAVYLNSSIGTGLVDTNVNGDLVFGSAGVYTLDNGSHSLEADNVDLGASGTVNLINGRFEADTIDLGTGGTFTFSDGSLIVDSIDNSAGGTFNYSGGHLTLYQSGLTVGSAGLMGSNVAIGAGDSLTLENHNILTLEAGSSFSVSSFLRAGQVDNSAGGTFTYGGGTLWLTDDGLDVSASGLLGNSITLTSSDQILRFSDAVSVAAGGSLVIDGGSLTTSSVTNLGTFSFVSGDLALIGSDVTVDPTGLLGNAVSITGDKTLIVGNQLVISAGGSMTVDGGALNIGSLDNSAGGSFVFNSGYLGADNNLSVGSGGLSDVALGSGSTLNVRNHNTLTIDSGSSVALNGGALQVGSINNNGSFNFSNGSLDLTNAGIAVDENGLLGNSLTIAGGMSLTALSMTVGNASGATDTANQTGGLLVLDGVGGLDINNGGAYSQYAGDVHVIGNDGVQVESGGSFSQSGGFLFAEGNGIQVDTGATFAQTNGTVQIQGSNGLSIASGGAYDMSGGDLEVTVSGALTVDGAFTHTGGRVSGLYASGSANGNVPLILGAGGSYTLDGGSLFASTIDRSAGGTFSYLSGTIATGDNVTVDSNGLLGDSVSLTAGKSLGAGNLVISSSGSVLIDGGSLSTHMIDNTSGGSFTYISGGLSASNPVTIDNGAGRLLGSSVTLGAADNMSLGGLTVGQGGSLVIDGGDLDTPTMSRTGTGMITFNSGNLSIGEDTTLVGSSGLLGNSATLDGGHILNVDGALTVGSGGTLNQNGGTLVAESIGGSGYTYNSGHLRLSNQNVTIGTGGLFGQNAVLSGSGIIDLEDTSGSYGRLTVSSGGSLTLNNKQIRVSTFTNNNMVALNGGNIDARTVTNSDSITLNSGSLSAFGDFVNNSGGSIDANDANLGSSDLDNRGTIDLTGHSDFYSTTVNNRGSISLSDEARLEGLIVENRGSVEIGTGATVNLGLYGSNNAEYVQLSGNTSTIVNGELNVDGAVKIEGGELSGSGTLNADLYIGPGGELAPGNSPGSLEVNGDFFLDAGAILVLEIVASNPGGSLIDQLFVTGDYNLLGQVRFALDGVTESVFESQYDMGDFFKSGTESSNTEIADISVFDDVELLVNAGSNWFEIGFEEDGSIITTETAAPSPVPVPAALWLFLSGFLTLVGISRRKLVSL